MPTTLTQPVSLKGVNETPQFATALIDTGASYSFVAEAVAARLGGVQALPTPMTFRLGDGKTLAITHGVTAALLINGMHLLDTFLVLPGTGVEDVVLGMTTMRKFGLRIDVARNELYAALTQQLAITTKEIVMQECLTLLMSKLNLPMTEQMTDEQAIAAIVARQAPPSAVATGGVLSLLGLDTTATEPEVKGTILALQRPGNVVPAAQHQAVVTELATLKREQFFLAALRDEKITPAEEPQMRALMAKDFDTFAAFIGKRGRQTPVGLTPPAASPTAPAAPGLDDTQVRINAQLGLDTATFAKYAN